MRPARREDQLSCTFVPVCLCYWSRVSSTRVYSILEAASKLATVPVGSLIFTCDAAVPVVGQVQRGRLFSQHTKIKIVPKAPPPPFTAVLVSFLVSVLGLGLGGIFVIFVTCTPVIPAAWRAIPAPGQMPTRTHHGQGQGRGRGRGTYRQCFAHLRFIGGLSDQLGVVGFERDLRQRREM